MSGHRYFDHLQGMTPQFETRSEAEQVRGTLGQVRGALREQGQVMSSALTNNKALWETNKVLRMKVDALTDTCQRLERERNKFKAQLDAIPADLQDRAALQLENDQLRAANQALTFEMAASLMPEMDSEQRRAVLADMKAQAAELAASGLVPTQEEIARRDHARDEKNRVKQGDFMDGAAAAGRKII